MSTEFVWGLIASVGVIVVLLGGAVPAIRTQRAKATIDLQDAEIKAYSDALKAQDERWKAELVSVEERCKKREAEQEARHQREIGTLAGRIDAMTPEFARSLAPLVAAALREEGIGA